MGFGMKYEYDDNGNVVKADDENGGVWVWQYDVNNTLVYHKSPSTEWRKEYDEQNREVKYMCGNRIVVTTYDMLGAAIQTETTL